MKSVMTANQVAISIALIVCAFGCTLIGDNDDPWGCNDRKPLNLKNTLMPAAKLGQQYTFDFSSIVSPNLTLIDTAKAALYGFELDDRLFKGSPIKTTALDSFRFVGWENATQCMGRSDTFTTYISIKE